MPGTTDVLNRRIQVGQLQTLRAGAVLYRAGEYGRHAYRVRRGLLKLLVELETGQSRIVRLQSDGDWLALGGLLRLARAHTAIAARDTVVERFPLRVLRSLQQQDPGTFSLLLWQWHADLAKADHWIARFASGLAPMRVAHLVDYLASPQPGSAMDRVELLSVQEMGEIVGMTPESVSRVIAGFKRRCLLRKRPGSARREYLVDREELHRLAGNGGSAPLAGICHPLIDRNEAAACLRDP